MSHMRKTFKLGLSYCKPFVMLSIMSGLLASLTACDTLQEHATNVRGQIEELWRTHFVKPIAPSTAELAYIDQFLEKCRAVGEKNFPPKARGQIEGTVTLAIYLRKNGEVVEATIEKSSGTLTLDRAAKKTLKLAEPYPELSDEQMRERSLFPIVSEWEFSKDKLSIRNVQAQNNASPTR